MLVVIFKFHRDYLARFESKDTSLFCLQVMVGVIILYDHIHPMGAFAKKSAIDVSITIIRYLVTLDISKISVVCNWIWNVLY